jgi:two-component system, OmpR family, sensor kinase
MRRFLGGSIFRSSFLLAFSGAFFLAVGALAVVATTPVPFDFPASTLDVVRAFELKPVASQGAPLVVRDTVRPNFENDESDIARQISATIARQAGVPAAWVQMSFSSSPAGFAQEQFDVARRHYATVLAESARLYGADARFSPLIFGSFKVAIKMPDGQWRTVSRGSTNPQWFHGFAKGLLIALLLMLPLAWWFSRKLAEPIALLGDSANRIGSGRYEDVRVEGPKEVRQAATAMNQMQARIRTQINERAEMLAAIAHDLRTPLARLSFLLAEQPLSNRHKIEEEIAEMDQMIGTTMDYVRSETVEPVREKVDLRSLLESVVDDFVDRGHAAMLHSGPNITISADPLMLRRVLTNVIGNAVTHGLKARVKAYEDADMAIIEVRDEGPGMSDDDIAKAFEPFFRAERSRNRNTGGAGLGLAVAKRGVEVHNGKISLNNKKGGGLIVSIMLPI